MGSAEKNGDRPPHEFAFEAFGVRLAVGATDEAVLDQMRSWLPPGWKPCPDSDVEARFVISTEGTSGAYELTGIAGDNSRDNKLARTFDLDMLLEMLDFQLRVYLGRMSPDTIFVHAGAVAHNGAAMVLPSFSFGGKTTLVAALVRAGAVYFSDEFALIDKEGLVHPYAKPLSLRDDPDAAPHDHRSVESFGGVAGLEPVPLRMIVITTFKKGAEWNPQRLSAGAGAAALLERAVAARERTAEVMQTVSRAAERAVVIGADRGEADEVAPLLLEELEQHAG
jgi:hypothetical protein